MSPLIRRSLVATLVLAIVTLPLYLRARQADDVRSVETTIVDLQPMRPTVLASGVLSYASTVDLTAEVTARVADIRVHEGEAVKAGDLLMRLDSETFRNDVAREQASLRANQIDADRKHVATALKAAQLERTRSLFEMHMVSQSRYDEDSNGLELARLEERSAVEAVNNARYMVASAEEVLKKTEIRSPVDGQVIALPIKVGEIAIPSTAALSGARLLTVADTREMKTELKVDEGDIAKLAVGQRIDLFAAAYPDRPITAVVRSIALAPVADQPGRAYKVVASLADAGGLKLQSGMSCRAEVRLDDGHRRIAVPLEAMLSEAVDGAHRRFYVVVARQGVAHRVEVGLGAADDRWQALTKGVRAGDVVVVGPARVLRQLADGDRLDTRPARG